MTRTAIPQKTKDALLKEYSHRCAKCGGDHPQIHHINEDASNSDIMNLIPLCPNCHLTDQHNPTRKIEIPKLILFRRYKDPTILTPQFHPIYTRLQYLDEVEESENQISDITDNSNELIEFIASLEMGEFYAKRLKEILIPPHRVRVSVFGNGSESNRRNEDAIYFLNYRKQLIEKRESVKELIIEQLRYQTWKTA
ncbi:HNH endonuclease signature motif containing protein [Pontiellaceae bacterium B12219]|nr:HNH endonuclease signature motif containing protein [Pontiellaceae bacterium B12219]